MITAILAVIIGPWLGGIGAAPGTFTASIIRYGTPILIILYSLVSSFVIAVGLYFLAAVFGLAVVAKETTL